MSNYTLKAIVDKLNDFMVCAVEEGAEFAATRRHYEVTIEHVLIKLLEAGTGDATLICRNFNLDQDILWQALLANLARQAAGNQGKPGFSASLFRWLEQSLVANSLYYHHEQIRSVAILDALVANAAQLPGNLADSLHAISLDQLRKDHTNILQGSTENQQHKKSAPIASATATVANCSTETALSRFTHNLTEKARQGQQGNTLDPVFGREVEIRMVLDILSRRRKNNPILVGEPGVGKTAIVEGLALRIVQQDVPESLRGVQVLTLDLGLLQAGAGVKGEFEKRLQQVIEEVKASPKPIVLFIDEAHTLIGSGAAAGGSDAANLLKPALARGELRTIAATTWSEYKQYFERDAALERRFQVVKVDEPSEQAAIKMLSGLKSIYQKHHNILITDDAIEAAVKLSHRYITGRQLPDKAIDLLDTAAARSKMGQTVLPSVISDLQEQQVYLQRRLFDLEKQTEQGIVVEVSLSISLRSELRELSKQLACLNKQWQAEKALVDEINEQRNTLGMLYKQKIVDTYKISWMRSAIAETQKELSQLQKSSALIQAELNGNAIAAVVADWTGVPMTNMLRDDMTQLLELENTLMQTVVGQDAAISTIAQAIRTRRAGLGNMDAPQGVFLLTGPSGVGKTETARTVAKMLFGGERFLTTINLSEYQEAHTVSQLKGSPPGYVGYGEGGVLSEAVRQRPYSVVLLDEVEKAHPDVMNLFYQVFDCGILRDGEGREIDFRNCIILLTSNLASNEITQLMIPTEEQNENWQAPSSAQLCEQIRPVLLRHFAPALLARMQVVPFVPLDKIVLQQIAAQKLDKLAQRLHALHHIQMRCTSEALAHLVEQAYQPDRGARAINNIIEQQLEPNIARSLLSFMADDDLPDLLTIELDEQQQLSIVFADSVEDIAKAA